MPSFVARDGARVAYRDEGAGPALLFLHGLNADGRLFAAQAAGLRERFRVIRPDFRGHGETPAPAPADMARLGADVEDLVRHLDLDGIVGIGWSLGAMVLWRVLLGRMAPRFAGAVAVDMTPKVMHDPDWSLGLIDPALRDAPENETADARGRRIAAAILAEGRDEDGLVERIAPLLAQRDLEAVAAIGSDLFGDDFRPHLPRIATPTLVIHGLRSRYYAAGTAHYLADRLPDATVLAFSASGHAPHVEEPDAFNAAIRRFADAVQHQNHTGRMTA